MAREIITRVLCDRHLNEKDEAVDADTFVLGIANRPPHEMDLCPDCAGPVVEALQMLNDYGRPFGAPVKTPKTPKDPADRIKCPACEWTSPTEPSARTHAVSVHKRTLAQLRGEPTPFPCGVGDCPLEYTNNTARSQHQMQSHSGRGANATRNRPRDES